MLIPNNGRKKDSSVPTYEYNYVILYDKLIT